MGFGGGELLRVFHDYQRNEQCARGKLRCKKTECSVFIFIGGIRDNEAARRELELQKARHQSLCWIVWDDRARWMDYAALVADLVFKGFWRKKKPRLLERGGDMIRAD